MRLALLPARGALPALLAILAACSDSGTVLGGPSQLVSLTVAPLELRPPFSPDVHDYAVWCGPGPNSLSIAMTAAPGSTATLQLPRSPTSVTPEAVTLDADEDDAIVVQVAGDAPPQSYWIRCLPHDFPGLTFAPHPSAGTLAPGWYVLGNAVAAAGESGFAMVLDAHGTPVWYQRVAAAGAMDVSRRQDGSIAYVPNLGQFGADPTASFVIQALAPWGSRNVQAVGAPTDEHELHVLPNGDALVFSYPFVDGVDLTGLGTYGPGQTIADCEVQELAPDGALVWSWRGSDHIDPVREAPGAATVVVGAQNVVDPFHCNSIDVDGLGNLLVSTRNTNAVFYVDKVTGKVVWKLGGTAYSKDGAQLLRVVDDPQGSFSGQHDARFQPDGLVSMFDDHTNLPGVARGVEYAIDLASSTAHVAWQILGSTPSVAMGSFRSTSDGTWIVAWGMSSAPDQFDGAFTEVDASGHDLLDVSFTQGDATYRALKVAPSDFDIDVLRATAGHP
jgi:hypothetical protein